MNKKEKLALSSVLLIIATVLFVSYLGYYAGERSGISAQSNVSFAPAVATTADAPCGLNNLSPDGGCIYRDSNGTVSATFVEDATGMYVTLTAKNSAGKTAEVRTAFGIDSVYYDDYKERVVVMATNRENSRNVGEDQVITINLKSDTPVIQTVIPTPGFAGSPRYSVEWLYIPYNDHATVDSKDLVLWHVDLNGNKTSPWYFGADLVKKADWQNGFIVSTEVLNSGDILASFTGKCDANPIAPCVQYILNVSNQKVESIVD